MAADLQTLRTAVELHKSGRIAEAETLYGEIVRVDPGHADALHLLGVAAHQRGDHLRAVSLIRRAIAAKGNFAPFYGNLGAAHRALGQLDEAIESYQSALEFDPAEAGIFLNLGNVLVDRERYEEAARAYQSAVDLNTSSPEAWNALGVALKHLDRLPESIAAHRRALELQPLCAETWFHLGISLRASGKQVESIECYLRAVSMRPEYVDAHVNLGGVYDECGELKHAIRAYERALRADAKSAAAHFNRALAWLRGGDLVRGWPEYEWRWKYNGRLRNFTQPEWNGDKLSGTVLVFSEQGIGDEILFASCIPNVVANADRCLLECDARLVRLFARSFPSVHVFAKPGSGPTAPVLIPERFDSQIAAGSLPKLFRRTFDEFPRCAYLKPDAARVRDWKHRYQHLGGQRTVGISWRGGKEPHVKKLRSTSLTEWAAVLRTPDVAFVNLQYGDCRHEIDKIRRDAGITIHDWPEGSPLGDLDEFAARIAALDLVISVDNSTVHMAGALGTPCWAILPFASDWRWMLDRDDTPWYPSVRLLRQSNHGDWPRLFQTVAAKLSNSISSGLDRAHAADVAKPTLADAAERHFLRGNDLQTSRQFAAAAEAYRSAIELQPAVAKYHFNLANACLATNDFESAARSFAQSVARDSSLAEHAFANLGIALRQAGRTDDADHACRSALLLNPRSAAALNLRGKLRKDRGELDAAVRDFREATEIEPDFGEAWNNLGATLQGLGQSEMARAAYETALAIRPDSIESINNLGTLLHDLNNSEQALRHYRRALEVDPDFVPALTNLGMALDQRGASHEAVAFLDRALLLEPRNIEARFYRAIAALRQNDFARGWDGYEVRWDRGDLRRPEFCATEWDGSPLDGLSVLVYGEQGIGDEIFFASCIPELLIRESNSRIACNPRLLPLFARSFPQAEIVAGPQVVETDRPVLQANMQIAIGSLPRFFRRSERDFPSRRRYLVADPARIHFWRERIARLGKGKTVGISWRGGSHPADVSRRSITLDQWEPILSLPDVNFINLQYGDVFGELEHQRAIHRFPDVDPLRELDDFAALVSALDAVVTVDNTTAHLAGALGVPLHLLLPIEADWRWGRGTSHSLWYPHAVLHRQQQLGEWRIVIEGVAEQLRCL